jgi:beta-phosphoglucomutase
MNTHSSSSTEYNRKISSPLNASTFSSNNIHDFLTNYELFIFDLDDTLVKTEEYHYKSWLYILKHELREDFFIEFDIFCSKFHSNKPDNIQNYLSNELNIYNFEEVIKKKNEYYLKLIDFEKAHIKLIDGCEILLNKIIDNNKKFVIVSNSLKSNIDYFSELFPILKKSSKNYYREMFTCRKPNPECYLRVVSDFPNDRKIGFEDSITGIHAMTLVKEIDPIFINIPSYYYYDYIIKSYPKILVIENYKF